MYVLNGELVDKDAPGNIMYRYMGKAYNIPEYILYLAAYYAQISAGTTNPQFLVNTYGDDPIDQKNIERGIKWFNYIYGGFCDE